MIGITMTHDLSKLIRSTSDARLQRKLLAVSHFTDGKSRTEIAKILKVRRRSVNIWIKAYLDSGLEGLNAKAASGRPPKLTRKQLAQVKSYVVDNAIKPQGGRLQGKDIQRYIEVTFGVTYQKTNIYHLLHNTNQINYLFILTSINE